MWSADLKLVHLHSVTPLQARVFIRSPADELELAQDKYFVLLRPLYDLSNRGDSWHATLQELLVSLGKM